jgi:Carboxypeptidase regulatory-like domain/TonB dependent receptor/TonB-dependent Receptor Plug Domain
VVANQGVQGVVMYSRVLPKGNLVLFMLIIFVFNILCVNPVCAQVAGATLTGTVTDPSGSYIPHAQITITDVATGISRDLISDSAGFYTAPNLLPGNYEINISAPGFATQVRKGLTLTVGAQQVVNITMTVGQITQQVQVTGEAPAVQLASSTISAQVDATTVRELPLNGRSWTDLATLQPGVNSIETQPSFASGSDRGNRGFGSQATISGARPQQNNYRLDGISINDYSNGAPGSVLGGNLGVDAIQEFSVLTSNYSAEYGKTSGGVINAITRSGTNQFHGTAYEFLRNDALDARNFFDGPTIPPFTRNQFGVSVGGPIRKDKTFIFGDYEGVRQSKGITTVDTVPSTDMRNGIIHNKDGSITTVIVDPAVQNYLVLFPTPNGALTPKGLGNTAFFTFAGQQVVNENFVTARVDHKLTDKDNLSATYLLDRTPYTSPDGFNDVLLSDLTFRQVAVIEATHIFSPKVANSVRFGFNRVRADNDISLSAINPAAADLTLGAVPGRAAAQVSVTGLTNFSGGMGGNPTYFFRWNSFQGSDDAFVTRGAHSIKFGGVVERMQLNVQSFSNPNGVFTFGSPLNFLTNKPSKFNSALPDSIHDRGFRQTLYGAYIQDDWRFRSNLTLNLGLRYEMTTVMDEVHGRLVNLRNLTDPTPHLGGPLFSHNPTVHNFEPRVGFAWDPFHNGKTALRAGFGVFDVLPLPSQFFLMENLAAPYFLLGAVTGLPAGSFYTGAFPLLGLSSFRSAYIESDPHRNYVMQWNLNIQRQLTPSLTATAGFIGSRGVHMPFRTDDIDMVLPTLTPEGYLWPTPKGSGTKINPNFGSIRGMLYQGNSFYDALQVQLLKTMSHGFQLQGAFTWAKSIDTDSATLAGDQFGNSIPSLDWFDQRLTRGPSDFNVGRTLIINGTWLVPSPKINFRPASWAVSGWQVGGIYKVSDGIPFTATFGSNGDVLGKNSSGTFDFPDRLTGPGCQTLVNPQNPTNYIKTQCFAIPSPVTLRGNAGRNILTGPGLSEFDLSLFKNNYIRRISEVFNVQFRAELFNLFNRANFAPPSTPTATDIFDPTGAPSGSVGVLTSTTTTAREIQFAVKITW